MRYVPPGRANSVAWMLWHITRIEDATMNVLLADGPQVFHRGNWQSKLNSPYVDVGNEMSAEEIRALSEAVNLCAVGISAGCGQTYPPACWAHKG